MVNGRTIVNTTNSLTHGFYIASDVRPHACDFAVYNFDTSTSDADSESLVEWLQETSNGRAVLGITAGDASQHLTQSAKNTLSSLGVDVTDLGFNCKAAFFQIVGQPVPASSLVGPASSDNTVFKTDYYVTALIIGSTYLRLLMKISV